MYSKILSMAPLGVDAMMINVESDISSGLPSLSLVGYLSSSVKEAGERVRTALKNSGFAIPSRRVTVNLSPADFRKEGSLYDLAIAMSILISMQIFSEDELNNLDLNSTVFFGELGLDGKVHSVSGVLAMIHYAKKNGIKNAFIPYGNVSEAANIEGINIYGISNLSELISFFLGELVIKPFKKENLDLKEEDYDIAFDIADIKGQKTMKRGMIIAVSGFHNILLTGAAGAGKSFISKCIPGIMPKLSYEESLSLTKIYSVAGLLKENTGLITKRPFRSPHHSSTQAALIGGGVSPRPGEVSLASYGVLFLDEFPEFQRSVIEALRQPMEDKNVTISRVRAQYSFPAHFMLVAARNNCPCGYYPDRKKCHCSIKQIEDYENKLSQPIMDRIDIRIEVSPVKYYELLGQEKEMDSRQCRELIEEVRKRQDLRFKNEDFFFNSEIPQKKIEKYIKLNKGGETLLKEAYVNDEMSARGYYKILKLSRTIADINDRDEIKEDDVAEALFYRNQIKREE